MWFARDVYGINLKISCQNQMSNINESQKRLQRKIEEYEKYYKEQMDGYKEYQVLKKRIIRTERRMRAVILSLLVGLELLCLWDWFVPFTLVSAALIAAILLLYILVLRETSCRRPILYRKGVAAMKTKLFQSGLQMDEAISDERSLPSADDYREAFFDAIGNVRSFCNVTETVEQLHVELCSYRSLDTMSDVIDCSITMQYRHGAFLKSLSGNNGPETEKTLKVVLPTSDDVRLVRGELPNDIRKKFLYVQLFPESNMNKNNPNKWNFFVWGVQDPVLFQRKMDDIISRMACLAASRILEQVSNGNSLSMYYVPDCNTVAEMIRKNMFKEEDLVPYFRLAGQVGTDEEKTVCHDIADIEKMFDNRNDDALILPVQYTENRA